MNKQGNFKGVGLLVVVAIGLIVALTLLSGGISGSVGQLTTTTAIKNQTITVPANNAYLDIPACVNYGGTVTVMNETGDGSTLQPAAQYSFTTRVSPTSSLKVLTYKNLNAGMAGENVNLTYTCLPQGFAEDSASRTISQLIILLCAVAIFVFAALAVKNEYM